MAKEPKKPTKTSKTKAKTTKPSPGAERRHGGKALKANVLIEPKKITPSKIVPAAAAAAAAAQPARPPRPPRSRYPVDLETVRELKQKARTRGKLGMGGLLVVKDEGSRKSTPGMEAKVAMLVEPVGAPASPGPAPAAPLTMSNFAGLSATGSIPPDCTMAVGPNHVMVAVNRSLGLFSKNGGPAIWTSTFDDWFSAVIVGADIFDPRLLYDQHAGRWVFLTVALVPGTKQSHFLIAVSTSSDPNGDWWGYILDATKDAATQTNNWADYPGLGVDNSALYVTASMFQFTANGPVGPFAYSKIRVIPKAQLYAGQPGLVGIVDFVKMKNADNSFAFSLQPCHTFGAPGVQYILNTVFPDVGSKNALTVWMVKNPLAAPTLTVKTITITPYAFPPDALQKGGGSPLDTGDTRVLNAVFRGGRVWGTFHSAHTWTQGQPTVVAIRWFQIDPVAGTVSQQGAFGLPGYFYFYPALMVDSNSNMIIVFSRSSGGGSGATAEFAAIRQTGRKSTDPLGKLQEPSTLIKAGLANYVNLSPAGDNRWGDYAGAASDPANSLKVWFYSLYAVAGNNWATQIGAAMF